MGLNIVLIRNLTRKIVFKISKENHVIPENLCKFLKSFKESDSSEVWISLVSVLVSQNVNVVFEIFIRNISRIKRSTPKRNKFRSLKHYLANPFENNLN